MRNWTKIDLGDPNTWPPENLAVETMIKDEQGARNQTRLVRKKNLWWFPDGSMYVYYTPTHWRIAQ